MSIFKAEDFANVVFIGDAEETFKTKVNQLNIVLACTNPDTDKYKSIVSEINRTINNLEKLKAWRYKQLS